MPDRAEALNTKGNQYLNGKDYTSAYKYFLEAARLGNSNAIYNVGFCCFNGYGVAKNYKTALNLLSKFANGNSRLATNAAYLCGLMLNDGGYGIEANKGAAAAYYEKAGEKGYSWAMFMLGRLYMSMSDFNSAIEFFEMVLSTETKDYELHKQCKKLLKIAKMNKRFGG